jgi:hypothetical protein
MALQKQQVPVSFSGGIDTKTDDKQVLATKLLELENGIFTKKGKIQKRHGYDLLLQTILDDSTSLSAATGVSIFKNELVLFSGTKLYSYIDASQAWKLKGSSTSVTLQNKSIIRNNFQQADQDYGFNQGLGCYVWKDSSAGIRYCLVDEITGATIVENTSLSSTGISPRVVGIGQYFFIYYIEGTTLKFKYIQLTTPGSISAALDLTTSVNATFKIYDVQKIGSRVYVAYNTNNGANSIKIFYQLPNKIVSADEEYVGEQARAGISIASDSANDIWLSWYDGTNVKYLITDSNLASTPLAPTTLETVANVRNIASTVTGSIGTFLYEITNSPDNFVRKNTGSFTGTIGTPSVFVRALGLGSKFFFLQFRTIYCFNSFFDSTVYVFCI